MSDYREEPRHVRLKLAIFVGSCFIPSLLAQVGMVEPIPVTLCDLLNTPQRFDDKLVTLYATIHPGIEDSPTVLTTDHCSTEGRLVGLLLYDDRISKDRQYRRLAKAFKKGREVEATVNGRFHFSRSEINGIVLQSQLTLFSVSGVVAK